MMCVRHEVGRLAEVLYRPPLSIEQLSAFVADVRRVVERASTPLVFVCDWRPVDGFDETFTDTIVWTMRRDNPRILANGVLVSASNVRLFDQVDRLLREAKNPARRVFKSRAELVAFLDPHLSDDERRRRDQFLDENERPIAAA